MGLRNRVRAHTHAFRCRNERSQRVRASTHPTIAGGLCVDSIDETVMNVLKCKLLDIIPYI
jgi:hypothetical protein